jgi:hypothetical protein
MPFRSPSKVDSIAIVRIRIQVLISTVLIGWKLVALQLWPWFDLSWRSATWPTAWVLPVTTHSWWSCIHNQRQGRTWWNHYLNVDFVGEPAFSLVGIFKETEQRFMWNYSQHDKQVIRIVSSLLLFSSQYEHHCDVTKCWTIDQINVQCNHVWLKWWMRKCIDFNLDTLWTGLKQTWNTTHYFEREIMQTNIIGYILCDHQECHSIHNHLFFRPIRNGIPLVSKSISHKFGSAVLTPFHSKYWKVEWCALKSSENW